MVELVQVLLSPRVGGAETLASSLQAEWDKKGVTSTIVYLDERDAKRGRVSRVRTLNRTLKVLNPQAVIAHSALPNLYARLSAPRGTRVITVLHSATDDFRNWSWRWSERLLSFRTSAVVAVSPVQHDDYASHFGSRNSLHLVPNGVSSLFKPKPQYAPEALKVVAVARLVKQKRPDVWTEVARLAHAKSTDFDFDWWGSAPDPTSNRDMVAAQDGLPRLTFRGPTDDVSRVLQHADVLLHTADREAFSIGLLEAAATGTPIICSKSVAETLPTEIPRWTFRDGDAGEAFEVLGNVAANWDAAVEACRSSAASIQQKYSALRCADAYLRLVSSGHV
jgi:glycosyltransferase involved in cell wall biosynthesis